VVRVIEVNVLNTIKGLIVKKIYYDNDCLELSLGFFVDAKINSEQIYIKFKFVRNEILCRDVITDNLVLLLPILSKILQDGFVRLVWCLFVTWTELRVLI